MHRIMRRFSAAALAASAIGPWPATYAQSPQATGPYPSGQGGMTSGAAGQYPFGGGPSGQGGMTPGAGQYPFGGDVGAGASGAGDASPYLGDNPLAPPAGAAGAVGGGAGAGVGAAPGMDTSPLAGGAPGAGGGGFGGEGDAGGSSPGLGGNASAAGAPPGLIGDYQPFTSFRAGPPKGSRPATARTRFPNLPGPLPTPTVPDGDPGIPNPNGATAIIFKLAGLKISDNQSPRPQDRVYYAFNYFDNLNASINKRLGAPIENVQVYHQIFGFEKTVFNGRGSIGFRLPLDTLSQVSTTRDPRFSSLGATKTALGDLSIIGKYALYDTGRTFFSVGLQVTAPTGPGGFAGNKYYSYFRNTQLQPFVGYVFSWDRFYVQGFSAINVPTDGRDVTLLFNDIGMGYFAYRAEEPGRFLTAIIPTVEAHLTTPLNHRGFDPNDLASTPDVLDLTFGVNTRFGRSSVLSTAYVTPVTGPKPFNAEFVLQLNIFFGGYRNRAASIPIIGG